MTSIPGLRATAGFLGVNVCVVVIASVFAFPGLDLTSGVFWLYSLCLVGVNTCIVWLCSALSGYGGATPRRRNTRTVVGTGLSIAGLFVLLWIVAGILESTGRGDGGLLGVTWVGLPGEVGTIAQTWVFGFLGLFSPDGPERG
ncbi:hypothetical protein NQ038_09595 [Brevibacterium sp. 50QC2O2]|uniref:hypothetical protein n=1 Tax=Brevibacterium TaxID=1696 RepID=UPI00211C0F7E|nr:MULTISPECIES: hypothetical protein [unclassified Brevibacterium]MCQ9366748.1 hypothetical protein [Brevibacterium sp. 91QC2O2]MCQ9384280.1 hypothetical protein [Brevibacterium sp. 68QC2CO]MCQ9388899.1 hypothetical protein [Brevibacterium sp. 50QC2O2]